MHDQRAAQFDLSAAVGLIVQQVQHVELAGAELPADEEQAAGIPERLRRAQQLEQRPIARAGQRHRHVHGGIFRLGLFTCQQISRGRNQAKDDLLWLIAQQFP